MSTGPEDQTAKSASTAPGQARQHDRLGAVLFGFWRRHHGVLLPASTFILLSGAALFVWRQQLGLAGLRPAALDQLPPGWLASAGEPLHPLWGIAVAATVSVLVFVHLGRMALLRRARDEALTELEKRRQAEAALSLSERRHRDVFASVGHGMLIIDPQGHPLEVNPAALAILGVPSQEACARGLSALVGANAEDSLAEFQKQLAAGGTASLEVRIQRGAHDVIDLELRGVRLGTENDSRFLVVMSDVSERKRTMERQSSLSRKVLVAHEQERARLSRELHDELGQLLSAIRLEMGWCKKRIHQGHQADVDMFNEAIQLVERAVSETRRICRGLRPPLLDDLGLVAAVENLIAEFESRTRVSVDLCVRMEEHKLAVPEEVGLCAFRILQESLTNVIRHAKATTVSVGLATTPLHLELVVQDNGVGFDTQRLRRSEGCGLDGMRERAKLAGATLEVTSSEGGGTRVSLLAPLAFQAESGRR